MHKFDLDMTFTSIISYKLSTFFKRIEAEGRNEMKPAFQHEFDLRVWFVPCAQACFRKSAVSTKQQTFLTLH